MSTTPPFQDPFELLKKMWAPLGLPMPGMVAPLLDANEIDRRIADLKSVENWLGMNLSMLRMTIQGLEMQKSTLAAFQAMHASGTATQQTMADTAAAATTAATRAAEAWWSFLQASQPEPQKPSEPSGKP